MATKLWKKIVAELPMDRSFRVSVKVRKGKKEAYAYVNCLNTDQFKNWLKVNEPKLLGIVKVI
jgi:hypothetical protein